MRSRKIAKKIICRDCPKRNIKWLGFSGLTPPAKRIRAHFFRKKYINKYNELMIIIYNIIDW